MIPIPGSSLSGSGFAVAAPAAIQRRIVSICSAESFFSPGGISPDATRCTSKLRSASPAINPRVNDVVTRLPSSSGADKVSRTNQIFDRFNDPIQTDEFDYGSGAPGGLLRRTKRTYLEMQYGLDYAEQHRNLPYIAVMNEPL